MCFSISHAYATKLKFELLRILYAIMPLPVLIFVSRPVVKHANLTPAITTGASVRIDTIFIAIGHAGTLIKSQTRVAQNK